MSTLRLKGGVLTGSIDGKLPSMKNSRRIVRSGMWSRPRSIKSDDALDFLKRMQSEYWISVAAGLLDPAGIPMKGPLKITVTVYQDGRRRKDLDIELLCDALEAVGLLANDFDLWEKHAKRLIDRERPRVEFTVAPTK